MRPGRGAGPEVAEAETESVSAPLLRVARFADYPDIQRLESTFFDDSLPPAQRRSLFVDNPLWPRLRDTWPIGWVLEDDRGRIVGAVNNIPSAYRLGTEELLCGNGHCWAVLPAYRGYAAMLMDEYFCQPDPDLLVSAKVGADAAPVWGAYATRVPVGDWASAAYAITRYRPFARAGLVRKGLPGALAPPVAAALRIKDTLTPGDLPADPPSVDFRELDGFDERFDAFWDELRERHPGTLLGVRDAAALRWHYGIPLRAGRLWVTAALRGGRIRAYCVLKQHHRPPDVSSLKLVDYQTLEPDTDLLPGIVRLAKRRAAAERCAFLEHHGCGLPKMRAFERIARYRAVKPSWSFFYYTEDSQLAKRLAEPDVWDPSEFDGDSSYK